MLFFKKTTKTDDFFAKLSEKIVLLQDFFAF